ncbi:MAG: thioredoxin domain-containing protein [Xanthomonadales bacterium]
MNRLSEQSSLYLRQHAANPVHWYPWCDAALDAARQSNRPILLSIGYSACHWCHVMAHESFEHEETARLMNDLFVNIKVDREERPDLDRIYQLSHQLLTGRGGGWPLTVFLDPLEHIPFFAGTYFPPEPRHGMLSFRDLLSRVHQWYDQNRDQVTGQNNKLREAITAINQPLLTAGPAEKENREAIILEAAARQLLARHDPVNGGYGDAPKFPQAPLLSAVSTLGDPASGTDGARLARSLAFTLETMARSGLRDHLDGGFFRYCVDATWTIPHFEKMLYDNAMLLPLYAEGAKRWNSPVMTEAAEGIASWLQTSMRHEDGGYSASIDADAGGEEGSFHVWHKDEVDKLLPESSRQIFCRSYGLDQAPNFEGKAWHLVRRHSAGELAKAGSRSEQAIEQVLEEARSVLISAREQRVHPTLDDKRLTSWNALLAEGFVRAGLALGRDDWLDSADQIIQFILHQAWDGERLFAVYNAGEAKFAAYLDDYAWLLNAILLFLQARWKDDYLHFATLLGDALLARFQDPEHGGFFFSDADVDVPIARSMIFQDDATPAGNAIAVSALQKLGALTGELQYTEAAQRCLARGRELLRQSPLACASALPVLQESVNPQPHIIISGTSARQCEELKQWVNSSYQVDCYVIGQAHDSLPGILAEYRSSEPVTAWVCHGMQCMPGADSRAALKQRLEETSLTRHQGGTGPK